MAATFINAGFVNVKENVIKDLIFGWLKKDGAVDSVMIDGDVGYKADIAYRVDVPIVISYHTFKV